MTKFCQGCAVHHDPQVELWKQTGICKCTCHVPGGQIFGRSLNDEMGWSS
jgi:hypothetical protein